MVRPGHERARAGGGVRARTRKWSCLDTNGPDWRRRSGQGSEMVVPGHERALLGAAFAPRPGNGRAWARTGPSLRRRRDLGAQVRDGLGPAGILSEGGLGVAQVLDVQLGLNLQTVGAGMLGVVGLADDRLRKGLLDGL